MMSAQGARLKLAASDDSRIAPLTPPDCDLQAFPSMMLDIPRLFGSGFNAKASAQPLAWMVGVKLWCRSWHQVPAASLPESDEELCHLAELGFDLKAFRKAKPLALHGWVLASDGRLYHPVVAENALAAWLERPNSRLAGAKGNSERWKTEFDASEYEADIERATDLLKALNPQHRALARVSRRAASRKSPGVAK